jgi:hypothetical protein
MEFIIESTRYNAAIRKHTPAVRGTLHRPHTHAVPPTHSPCGSAISADVSSCGAYASAPGVRGRRSPRPFLKSSRVYVASLAQASTGVLHSLESQSPRRGMGLQPPRMRSGFGLKAPQVSLPSEKILKPRRRSCRCERCRSNVKVRSDLVACIAEMSLSSAVLRSDRPSGPMAILSALVVRVHASGRVLFTTAPEAPCAALIRPNAPPLRKTRRTHCRKQQIRTCRPCCVCHAISKPRKCKGA